MGMPVPLIRVVTKQAFENLNLVLLTRPGVIGGCCAPLTDDLRCACLS